METTTNLINESVLLYSGNTLALSDRAVNEVKILAKKSTKLRGRVLLHPNNQDSIHEMLICLPLGSFDMPHINFKSAKSFTLINGECSVVCFSDDGTKLFHHHMAKDANFFVRLQTPNWHTIIPLSDEVVFIETILGPFTGNLFPDWIDESNYLDLKSRVEK